MEECLKIIKDKKINKAFMIAFVYLSFCFSSYFNSKAQFSHWINPFLSNKIVVFFLGGIVSTLIYELVTSMMFKTNLSRLGGGADDGRYALRFFIIPANIVVFLFQLLYIPYHFLVPFGEIFFTFLCYLLFFILFIWYAFKHIFDKSLWSRALMSLGSTFLTIYGIIGVMNLIFEVVV